jgi:ABC-2 type transport system permease protein
MTNLLRSELFRVRKRPQSWWLLAVLVALEVMLYGIMVIVNFASSDPTSVKTNIQLPKIYDTGLVIVALAGTILAIIFGSSTLGSEYGWNTLRPLLARSRSRSALLSAKWLTIAIYTLALAIIGVLATMSASVAASLIVGEGAGVGSDTILDLVAVSARYFIGIFPYAALAMMLAVVTRSNTAGIAIAIALNLLEPAIFGLLGALSDVFHTLEKGGLAWNVNRIVLFGGDNDVTASQATISVGVIAIYVALFIIISFRLFSRRDVTSG